MTPEDVEVWAAVGWAFFRAATFLALAGLLVMAGAGLGHLCMFAFGFGLATWAGRTA